jgi:hypothetical protein
MDSDIPLHAVLDDTRHVVLGVLVHVFAVSTYVATMDTAYYCGSLDALHSTHPMRVTFL